MRASVVIVNWNAGEALARASTSLADDARSGLRGDRGRQRLERRQRGSGARPPFPWLTVVETGAQPRLRRRRESRGRAGAAATSLVFLNPGRARAAGRGPDAGRRAAPRARGAGIAGGGLVDGAGAGSPARHASGRSAPRCSTPRSGGSPRAAAASRIESTGCTAPSWPCARDLFRQLGGFDPAYFLYGEDMDLCHRAARLGARTHPRARRAGGARRERERAAALRDRPRGRGREGRAALLRAPRAARAAADCSARSPSCKFGREGGAGGDRGPRRRRPQPTGASCAPV